VAAKATPNSAAPACPSKRSRNRKQARTWEGRSWFQQVHPSFRLPLSASSVASRAIQWPTATCAERVPTHALVQAWSRVGAPVELFQDLVWGIFVPTKWEVPTFQVANYQSYHDNQAAVDAALEELRVAGKLELVNPADLSSTIIAPLGVVPKPSSNKIRVIHNLSILVNDSVTTRDLSLPTIEKFLKWVSPSAWMWKRDWKGGYQ